MNQEQAAFEVAFSNLMIREGYISNDPIDKGGATKYGISKRFLELVTGGPVTTAFVMGLSLSDAKEIYRTHFWYAPKFHRIHDDQMRECVFDQGVNRGTHQAGVMFQTAINSFGLTKLSVDGSVGPKTIEAFSSLDPFKVRLAFIKECQLAYARIAKNDPTQLRFLIGWISRSWTYL